MLRVGVLVSGSGSNLQALIDFGLEDCEIALVVSSSKDAFALQRAKNHGIPSVVVETRNSKEFEVQILKALREFEIDLVVLAGFMRILSEEFVSAFPHQILNVHPSLIPAFCGEGFYGMKVHQAVIDYGVKVSGASVHFVNEIVDGGQVIAQQALALEEGETPQSLQKKVLQIEHQILPQAVQKVVKERWKERMKERENAGIV